MKEHGILFTPENIRLVMSGVKVQTRRVVKWEMRPESSGTNLSASSLSLGFYCTGVPSSGWVLRSRGGPSGCWNDRTFPTHCPYGDVGDRMYVKEGIITHAAIPQLVGYYMDGCRVTEHWEKRRTAMFMPKWAARTWLEVTDVRVERVQDISEEDAIAEGCTDDEDPWWRPSYNDPDSGGNPSARKSYEYLWDSINAKRDKGIYAWEKNPFVFAISFKRI